MTDYFCQACSQSRPIEVNRYCCDCGQPFSLLPTASLLSPSKIAQRPPTLWRYREALPISDPESVVTFDEGMTPLIHTKSDYCDHRLKLDFIFPTGSYKDRGASVLLSKVRELGITRVVEDSSGNAGAAVAAYSAKAGVDCTIYCPEKTSAGKLTQISLYGADLQLIPGNRAQTTLAVLAATATTFYASHNWNPFFLAGVQTVAFEIAEQLGWTAPDAIICPVGFGSIYLGLHLGFRQLQQQGLIEKLPRLLGVQSEACCPIFQADVDNQTEIEPMKASRETLAEGIISERPVRDRMILTAIRETKGAFTTVSEAEIKTGLETLAREGIYVEPTSAVVVKALDHFVANGVVDKDQLVISILTGSGLKATEKLTQLFEAGQMGCIDD